MKNKLQKNLYWVLLVFLAIGLVYPAIGVIALICMLAPVAVSFYKGRFWCGNFCPRGSFFDNVLSKVSPKKPIPKIFKSLWLRVFMLLLIMAVFGIQTYYAWGSLPAMGMIFIRIILVTTIVGIVLGMLYNQRTWCSFCPMGTLSSWVGAWKKRMPINTSDSCTNCNLCSKVCPMQLAPNSAKWDPSGFTCGDCIKCGVCIEKCPKKSLSFK